jgi:hypothetical protein
VRTPRACNRLTSPIGWHGQCFTPFGPPTPAALVCSPPQVPPVIDSLPALRSKLDMVEALLQVSESQRISRKLGPAADSHPIDAMYANLGAELTPAGKEEVEMVRAYAANTHGATHSIKVRSRLTLGPLGGGILSSPPRLCAFYQQTGALLAAKPLSHPLSPSLSHIQDKKVLRMHAVLTLSRPLALPYRRSRSRRSSACTARTRRATSVPTSTTGSCCGTARDSPTGQASSRRWDAWAGRRGLGAGDERGRLGAGVEGVRVRSGQGV